MAEQSSSDPLRLALRRLARSVAVITALHEGRRMAMAATAVCEVSLDPPTMLICVNRSSSMHPALAAGAAFAINLLREDQRAIAETCSGAIRGEARFEVGTWREGLRGLPLLEGALAAIQCETLRQVDCGTHSVLFGAVIGVALAGPAAPLLYAEGGYRGLAPPGGS